MHLVAASGPMQRVRACCSPDNSVTNFVGCHVNACELFGGHLFQFLHCSVQITIAIHGRFEEFHVSCMASVVNHEKKCPPCLHGPDSSYPLDHFSVLHEIVDSLLGRKADVSGSALSQFWIGYFVAVTEWGGGNNKNWRWVARFYRCRFRSRSQKHRRYFQADGLSAGQR